ncbi:uncharacterized protein LOC129957467 isoform X1 [Argiope bruennichi]|uniref:uncharacterized protein LOC129957467 isoform X1 n=2 Tax=Argiope bruennichi TaxID=94029 RepID=UPI00249470C1|nr:uncharacterized protein LOC129957467 isoform X1 [Argiope bruennichi]
MSFQDNIEEFQQSLVDTTEASEINSHSVMTTISPDLEDATAVKILKHCTRPSNEQESADDTASTSEAVDINNQVVLEQPDPRQDVIPVINQDLPNSTCGLSDSISLSTADSSSDWSDYFEYSPPCGILGRFYQKYARLALRLRRAGAYNWPLCPADVYIPRYVFFNGAIATLSVCVRSMNSLWTLVLHRSEEFLRYMCAFLLGWVAIVMTLIEMTEFYTMSYSFHKREENYCNEVFYWFVYYKNIVFGVIITLTALLYIPGLSVYYYADRLDFPGFIQ